MWSLCSTGSATSWARFESLPRHGPCPGTPNLATLRFGAAAGFVDVSLTNRDPWYRTVAREELARLEGAGRDAFLTVLDEAALDEQVGIWRAMIVVLNSGEHCPHHFRGRKP